MKKTIVTNLCIFLDLDGVLNSDSFLKSQNTGTLIVNFENQIDPKHMPFINQVVAEKYIVPVVLSTFWRSHHPLDKLKEVYSRKGFLGNIIDVTPTFQRQVFEHTCRGREIRAWLKENPHIKDFIIIDDYYLNDSDLEKNHFIKTDPNIGFTENETKRTIKLLEEKLRKLNYVL